MSRETHHGDEIDQRCLPEVSTNGSKTASTIRRLLDGAMAGFQRQTKNRDDVFLSALLDEESTSN